MEEGKDFDFDYTARAVGRGVVLIVRPGYKYGQAEPGQKVLVDKSELNEGSTCRSCMTPKEAAELERKRVAAAKAAKSAPKATSSIKAIVEAGMARLRNPKATEANKAAADAEVLQRDSIERASRVERGEPEALASFGISAEGDE